MPVTVAALAPSGPTDNDANSPRGVAVGAASPAATPDAPLLTAPTPPAPADFHANPPATTQEAFDIAATVLHGRVTAVFRLLSSAINDGYNAKLREAAVRDKSHALKQNLKQHLDENARETATAAAAASGPGRVMGSLLPLLRVINVPLQCRCVQGGLRQ